MLLVSDVAESVSVTYPVPDTGPVTKERHSKLFLNARGRMSWRVHSVCPALTSSLSAASSPSQKTHTPCRGEPRDCSLLQCLRTSISSSGLNVSQPRSVNRHFNPSPSSFPSASYSIHCTHPPSGWVWFSSSESNLPFSFPAPILGSLWPPEEKNTYMNKWLSLWVCNSNLTKFLDFEIISLISHEPLQAFEVFLERGCMM